MLPNGVLSTTPVVSPMLPPLRDWKVPLVDYELGGVAFQDATEGLQVQTWTAEYRDGGVYLSADSVAEFLAFEEENVTEISLAFDQNMNYAIAYMVDGFDAKLRWFDTTVSEYVTLDMPLGSYDLRITMDDKREMQTAVSDMILTYLRDGTLYYRQQRDRFEDEYTLYTGLVSNQTIAQFGMNYNYRLQWNMRWVQPLKAPTITRTSPPFLYASEVDTPLVVFGTGFLENTRFYLDDEQVDADIASEVRATLTVPGEMLVPIGVNYTISLQARTPKPGGGGSNVLELSVRDLTSFRLTEDNDVRITEDEDFRTFERAVQRLLENGIDLRVTEDGIIRISERS